MTFVLETPNIKIITRKNDKNAFLNTWAKYIEVNTASYKYLPLYVDFMLGYIKNIVSDESFVIVRDNTPVAIAFLPVEQIDNKNLISLCGDYTIAPLAINNNIEKTVFDYILYVAKEYNVQSIKFLIDPLIVEYTNKFNHLIKYGFVDTSSSDGLMDMRPDKEEIWKNIRKSYKPLINGILKNPEYEIVKIDAKNPDYDVHEKYRELHHKCSGRITRAKSTFDAQFEMLKNDLGSIFGLKKNGVFIGFNYFLHYQKTAVYYSASDDPDYENFKIPTYHALLWVATEYYKERGFEFMQYSNPCGYAKASGFDDYLDEKQLRISSFKIGMGVNVVPFFRGVRYFNKELFLEDLNKFKNEVEKSINESI